MLVFLVVVSNVSFDASLGRTLAMKVGKLYRYCTKLRSESNCLGL